MNQFTMPDDFTSRYGRALAPAPSLSVDPDETVAGREARLVGDIGRSDNTIVSYAFNLDRRIDKIKSLLSTGDIAAAKWEYDDHNSVVSENRDGFLALAGLRNAGRTGDRVAGNSRYAAMSGIDSEEVTMMGRKVRIGDVLGNGSQFLAEQANYAESTLGFDKGQLQMYYGVEDAGYDAIDRKMMKSCIDPFVAASGKSGASPVENHMQIRSLARTVFDNRDGLRSAFGSRAGDVVDFIIGSHGTSGGHSEALQSLMEIGEAYKGTSKLSPEQVADRMIASYGDLVNSVFGPDKQGKYGNITGDQRRLFDTALKSTVQYAKGADASIDFQNPRFRRAFKVAMNEFAACMDYGVDLFTRAKNASSSPAEALGEYIGKEALGLPGSPGNIIQNMRGFRTGIQQLVTGGDDFEPAVGDGMTGRAGMRNTVSGRLGGTSSCPAADALASSAHEFLMREFVGDVVAHNDLAKAIRRRMMSGGGRAKLINGLAGQYAPSFSGSGARTASRMLAERTLQALTTGEPMNIQNVITRLGAADQELALSNPAAAKTFASFLRANVADDELKGMRLGLVQHGMSVGMSEPEAQSYATSQITALHQLKRTGGNYRLQYNRTMRSGPMYAPGLDRKGRPAIDPETGLPVIMRTFVNYDDATGGRFYTDPEYAAKFMGGQRAYREQYETGLKAKASAAVARAKQN